MVVEADKGTPTCMLKEQKVNKMVETERNNQNRYYSLNKEI